MGASNLGATFTGGYPVTGGFSRSVVNFSAGANTGLASIITGGLIALTVIFLTPLFYYLPNAVLAADHPGGGANLIDVKAMKHIWQLQQRATRAALIITFTAVLAAGIETGILIGAGVALAIYHLGVPASRIRRWSGGSVTAKSIAMYYAMTSDLAECTGDSRRRKPLFRQHQVSGRHGARPWSPTGPRLCHVVLIGTAINFIDASALETLESLQHELTSAGVELHLAAIKGPVLDRLADIGFVDEIGADHFHFSTQDAMIAIGVIAAEEHGPDYVSPAAAAKSAAEAISAYHRQIRGSGSSRVGA